MTTMQLKGVGVALITPFNENLEVDFPALEKLIEFTLRGKVDYLVTLGTTGEVATLNTSEQIAVIEFTVKLVNGRLPVIVGIGGNDTRAVINKIQTLPLEGISAILSVTPYYNKPSQLGLYNHYAMLAEASSKPIILYNVPGRTSSNILPQTVVKLANDFKGKIVGIKEASGNMVQCMHLVKSVPEDFLLISGDDHLALPLIACGFQGVISVVANAFPSQFCQMIHLALNNNFKEALAFQTNLLDKMDLLFVENNPAGVKAFLAEMNLIENYLRPPLTPLSENWMDQVKTLMR